MIFIWHFVLTTFCVGMNEAFDSSNTTFRIVADAAHRRRGIDDPTRDRNWERYLNQLKRLKLHEMKKTIRARVLSEKFHPYFSLKHIRRRLELLELYDPDSTEVGYVRDTMQGNAIHRTISGQGILYVKISEADEADRDQERKGRKFARPIVLLVAGIAGSDWTAVHVIMHLVTNLVTSYRKKKLSGFDWWIIPLLNPDGYINSMDNKMSRYYTLNINPADGCWGVNLDRNFLFQRAFCRNGKMRLDCLNHSGKFPFSEIESRALRDFVSSRVDDCKVFVAVKEGAKALVYPFASTSGSPPGAHATLQDLLCMEALEVFDQSHRGPKNLFKFGNSGSIFGLSSGYVEDWARRHMGIARSFAFYIAHRDGQEREPMERLREYGKATLNAIQVLATSRRIEPYAETFQELINQTRPYKLLKHRRERPTPWGRELVHDNLRDKINRGAKLEMPIELTSDKEESRYDHLDFSNENLEN